MYDVRSGKALFKLPEVFSPANRITEWLPNGHLLMFDGSGKRHVAIDSGTGRIQWDWNPPSLLRLSGATADALLVADTSGGSLRVFGQDSLGLLWERPMTKFAQPHGTLIGGYAGTTDNALVVVQNQGINGFTFGGPLPKQQL